ncbi:hypothetical protein BKA64DRAFT_772657 [Cadophora sp. MPI-SDFR-AT-0126]|nr:hypothetical protein BKA64DRAFT_772657 [Leotiomycetes sp. MPI-SDFR-AT-0126]
MLPQDPRESYVWNDSCFNDWIKSSPDAATYLHTDESPASRQIRIVDLLSSLTPSRSTGPSIDQDIICLDPTEEPVRNLIRSPRSADLVSLRQKTGIPRVGQGDHDDGMHPIESYGNMKSEHQDTKGKGKVKDTCISAEFCSAQGYHEEEYDGFWTEYKKQVRTFEDGKYNYDDRDFDMNFTDEYRRAKVEKNSTYLNSSPHSYLWPGSSPTWGRGREGTSSSDFNYDHMAIEELMKGMDVYSDTDYEQTEDMSNLSRILFGRSCSPGIGSSRSYDVTANGKRKASQSLEEPDYKKRYIANPLRGQTVRSSVNPLLHGKGMAAHVPNF